MVKIRATVCACAIARVWLDGEMGEPVEERRLKREGFSPVNGNKLWVKTR